MFQLERYSKNPILESIKEHSWESKMVFNPAVVYKDKKIQVIYRAIGKDENNGVLISRLGHAIFNKDGVTLEKRHTWPIFEPKEWYEPAGCEDPRITKIDGKYYLLYTAYFGKKEKTELMMQEERANIAMASTKDFINWERHGMLLPEVHQPEKNGVLFPEKINGYYVCYYRIEPNIYVAYSKSLEKSLWCGHKVVASIREGLWDGEKIGAGAPPIKTKLGWLFIYHGVDKKSSLRHQIQTGYGTVDYDRTYRLGVMLIDKNDPTKVIYRSKGWILEPQEKYEKEGMIPNVVFSCGTAIVDDELYVYYGGADTVIGVAKCKLEDLLQAIEERSI